MDIELSVGAEPDRWFRCQLAVPLRPAVPLQLEVPPPFEVPRLLEVPPGGAGGGESLWSP